MRRKKMKLMIQKDREKNKAKGKRGRLKKEKYDKRGE
jgi:hypothetical protein